MQTRHFTFGFYKEKKNIFNYYLLLYGAAGDQQKLLDLLQSAYLLFYKGYFLNESVLRFCVQAYYTNSLKFERGFGMGFF